MVTKKFIQGDCISVLSNTSEVFNLILTDPPYNIGWNYSDKVNDRKVNYCEWCLEWAELCISRLKESGVLAIINYSENNNLLYADLIRKGYNFVQELIWYYPTNVGQSIKRYTRNFRTIIIFSKSKEYTFNAEKQEYKNPNDKRIKERIKNGFAPNHYSTFEFNLCKNVSMDKKRNGINQLPRDLVEMLIKTYSNKGDYICDPFVGNWTIIDISEELDRNSLGIDINDYKSCATKRGVSELKLSKAQSPNTNLKEFANTDSQISSNDETSLNNHIQGLTPKFPRSFVGKEKLK